MSFLISAARGNALQSGVFYEYSLLRRGINIVRADASKLTLKQLFYRLSNDLYISISSTKEPQNICLEKHKQIFTLILSI